MWKHVEEKTFGPTTQNRHIKVWDTDSTPTRDKDGIRFTGPKTGRTESFLLHCLGPRDREKVLFTETREKYVSKVFEVPLFT